VKEAFPFSFKDVWICLELTWLGLPAGLIIWFFLLSINSPGNTLL